MSLVIINVILACFIARGWLNPMNINDFNFSYAITADGITELTKEKKNLL